ncbi:MAG: hypothetical protein D3911_09440 [Candidatus Electrothrix sp. AW3_4]|nr:hypothetical protein [Candidatus Electrothrix gigas]
MSKKYQDLIYKNVVVPLSSIPFHSDCSCIERAIAEEFPVHLAIHRITKAQDLPQKYVELHKHSAPEINILIGDEGEMEYRFQLGDEIYNVSSPSSIWIPSELKHAANLIKGSGTYVCVILSDTYITQ